jgi:hypothetical protein
MPKVHQLALQRPGCPSCRTTQWMQRMLGGQLMCSWVAGVVGIKPCRRHPGSATTVAATNARSGIHTCCCNGCVLCRCGCSCLLCSMQPRSWRPCRPVTLMPPLVAQLTGWNTVLWVVGARACILYGQSVIVL